MSQGLQVIMVRNYFLESCKQFVTSRKIRYVISLTVLYCDNKPRSASYSFQCERRSSHCRMSSARTYHTEDGGEDGPADHHVGVDPPAVHHLQVVIETTHACKQTQMQLVFLFNEI